MQGCRGGKGEVEEMGDGEEAASFLRFVSGPLSSVLFKVFWGAHTDGAHTQ